MHKQEEIQSDGDSVAMNPDNPIFAPMQAALLERFKRKNADIEVQIRYDPIYVYTRDVNSLERRKLG